MVSRSGFVVQALGLAIESGDALLGLGDAIPHGGSGGNGLQNRITTLLLLALDFDQRIRGRGSFLLALLQLLLGGGHIGTRRLQGGSITFQFLLQARCLLLGIGDLSLRSGGAGIEFGTALFVGATAGSRAI